ncbi:MAG: helix-turn-helix transcriptional regulator [Prevotellaceae bacterium]|nr:helix-turn-helix transcriptional regulator [Prevotellaceae bacterium]
MIYDRIKETCKKQGKSVNTLEKELGLAKGSLCKIDTHKPSANKIERIANYLNVTTEYILSGEEKTKKVPTYSRDHLEMIKMYESVDEESKKKLMDMIRLFTGYGTIKIDPHPIRYSIEESDTKSDTNDNK